jgi:transcriptional repressor NrdR
LFDNKHLVGYSKPHIYITKIKQPHIRWFYLKMKCPYCGTLGDTSVLETSNLTTGEVRRRRKCKTCGNRFNTFERSMLDLPQIVKTGGYREPFDREKVMKGLRLACVKRPVPTESLEQIANRVEDELRSQGKVEVMSSVVGNLIVDELRELDVIAYIRFAIVYLGLDDLSSIKAEVEKLIIDSTNNT